MYTRFHKFHHKWTNPVGASATYASVAEHIFCNIFSVVGSPIITGLHGYWILLFVSIVLINTVSVHSGYKFVNAKNHDDHHKYFRVNYGPIGIFDFMYGTLK